MGRDPFADGGLMFGFRKPRIEHLDRYVANREYDKALAAVAAELKANPSRFNLLLRQAEILGMAGDRDTAITVYRELAEHYAKDGFFAKSIALYKKVLRLNPDLEDVHSELARLIEEDARSQLPLSERLAASGARSEPPAEPTAEETLEKKELEASSLFSAFPAEALEDILASTSLRTYQEGDIIVTEGEEGTSLFLVVSGEVKVFTRGQRGEHLQLAELGPGDFFGEVSLLTGVPRTATITAKSQVNLIELTRASVDGISEDHPQVREVLESFYESRAKATVEAVIARMRET
jgi:cAMP-dependent protein kinase regulator